MGPGERALRSAVQGIRAETIDATASDKWGQGATHLQNVIDELDKGIEALKEQKGKTPAAAIKAFTKMKTQVEKRHGEMSEAKEALDTATLRLRTAEAYVRDELDGKPLGTGPKMDQGEYATASPTRQLEMEKNYSRKAAAHDKAVGERDAAAQKHLDGLNTVLDEQTLVMQKIHGENPNQWGGDDPGGGTRRSPIRTPGRTPVDPFDPTKPPPPTDDHPWDPDLPEDPTDPTDPTDPPPTDDHPWDPTDPTDPGNPEDGDPYVPPKPGNPGHVGTPTPGSPGGIGAIGGVGGVIGGGALGIGGALGGIKGGGVLSPGGGTRPIGGTRGAGGVKGGAIGRGGAMSPGGGAGRGTTGRGGVKGAGRGGMSPGGGAGKGGTKGGVKGAAKGAAGGRGATAGSGSGKGGTKGGARGTGGRGTSGGRGTMSAGAGSGRRKGDQENPNESEFFDTEHEWTDDEGAAPGVLD